MADDTRHELAEYKEKLSSAKQKLLDYRSRQGDLNPTHISTGDVLVVAINGLLTELNTIDPTTITLDAIVTLADDVDKVMTSAEGFLQRHNA